MPTNRTRIDRGRRDALTLAQRAHLECGHYFFDFDGDLDHFEDEAHRRRAWAFHRAQILSEWHLPGNRPDALWQYDYGLRPRSWPKEWSWPRPVTTEAEMVRRLLLKGEIEHCRLNGAIRISDEIAQIEADWMHEVRIAVSQAGRVLELDQPLPTWGTPVWFYREHARRVFAELAAERRAWRPHVSELLQ
jgi:hypothetical protein